MKLLNIYLLFVALLFSCNKSVDIELPQPTSISEVYSYKLPETILPYNFAVINNKLVVQDAYSKTNVFSVFDINDSLKFLYSFGSIGNSNREFASYNELISSKYLEIINHTGIKYVDVQDTIANVVSLGKKMQKLPVPMQIGVGKINDSIYHSKIEAENDKELLISGRNKGTQRKIGEKPAWSNGNMQLQSFCYNYSSAFDKFIMFYYSSPEYKIIDSNGKSQGQYKLKTNKKSNISTDNAYFYESYTTKRIAYSVLLWCNVDEISKQKDKLKINIVGVDWESGKVVSNYLLQGRQSIIYINEEKKLLYTYCVDTGEIKMYNI